MKAYRDRMLLGLALPLVLLVAWQVLGMATHNPRTPVPTRVATATADLIASGDLPLAIVQSLARVFGGFTVAALIAIPLGLAMASTR